MLAPLTTLGIGGPATYFVRVESEEHAIEALRFAAVECLDIFVLGGGSNLLVSDNGFEGLVIQVGIDGILKEIEFASEKAVEITARAGQDWDAFVAYCVENDLAGVECLSGIPGSVGGTPVQNVGAYGQEVSESIVRVKCVDRNDGKIVELDTQACGFGYRTSIFNTTMRERYIVLSVTYRLRRFGAPKIVYKDLREHFSKTGMTPTLAETRNAVLKIRAAKSMVIDPTDPNSRSAGSFFKNPVVPNKTADQIREKIEGGTMPAFNVDAESVKIPAAWLIEQAGFHKGFIMGNAGISTRHSLALINRGGAMADDIVRLMEAIRDRVEQNFGIRLVAEPVFVGFDK